MTEPTNEELADYLDSLVNAVPHPEEFPCPSIRLAAQRLREADKIREALVRASTACDCENLHHEPSEFHKFDEVCPVEQLIEDALTT